MAISDRLNKLTTDITNAYTSIENKGGTIPANKNTNNLPTAINSIEVIEQATAEGESLSLTNTKAMPYSDYVVEGKSEQDGEPSPSNPSEIHSVADDVNLFDGETEVIAENTYNGLLVLDRNSFWYNRVDISKIEFPLTISTYIYNNTSNITDTNVRISLKDENYNDVLFKLGTSVTNDNKRSVVTIEKSEITNEMKYLSLFVRIQGGGHTENTKIQYSSTVTPYSPYNQGTVTIKQRGKNLAYTGWAEDFVTRINLLNYVYIVTKDNKNCLFYYSGAGYGDYENKYMFKTEWKENTQYTIQCSILNTSEQITNNYNMTVHYTDGTYTHIFNSYQQNTWLNFKFTTALNKTVKYITSAYYAGNRYLDLDTFMVYEGTEESAYEPYQGYDKVFQTEPLRSLPNGVRDSLEADGIHRNTNEAILDGSDDEDWKIWSASLTNVERFYINIDGADIVNSLCDKFKYLPGNEDEEHYRDSTSGGMNKQFVIFINKSRLSEVSINGLKQYLQDNPIKLLYKLAEETIEPLTQNQATTMLDIIKTGSYEGTTNIYTDEDVKPTMKVGYYKKS